jgi:hypothetical protein
VTMWDLGCRIVIRYELEAKEFSDYG